MNETLQHIHIQNFESQRKRIYKTITLSFQVFGPSLNTAPIVLVNHALTGNSNVADPKTGWWKDLIGFDKTIDTKHYTVIAFNIYGNGYDEICLDDHTNFSAYDIAELQYLALTQLEVIQLYASIGGSVGGGIAWEMAVSHPTFIQNLFPIASAWKSSDWIIGQTFIQDRILHHSSHPLEDARMMAMLFYRTPQSFDQKFQHSKTDQGEPIVENWLKFHVKSLAERFHVQAYRTMNYILAHIDIQQQFETIEDALRPLQSKVIQIAIDSDIYFHKEANIQSQKTLDRLGIANEYHEIQSIHGHDAFLIEYTQLSQLLKPHFTIV
jgi:homoserine O-acetyltransferase